MGTLNPKPLNPLYSKTLWDDTKDDVFVLRGLGDYSAHWGNIRLIVGVYIYIYISV